MSTTLWPSWLPLREDLRNQNPYGAPQINVPVRLNTNENPYGPSKELVARIAGAVTEIAGQLNRYPDRDAMALREALAGYLRDRDKVEVTSDQVWAANGSNEVIQQLFMACGGPGRSAVGFTPSYSMHALIARATNTDWVAIARRADFSLEIDQQRLRSLRPSLIFVTSPNNPTGTAVDASTLLQLAHLAGEIDALLVVDEAYAEFARDREASALHLQQEYPHLVVLRTMSKAFALAGARVGYLIAHPSVVNALQLVRLPYHLSSITQVVAHAALAHADELLASVDRVRGERDRLVQELREMGLDVLPSDANFVLFAVPGNAHSVWQSLLDQGVLVRDVGIAGHLRVTAGTREESDRFLSALAPLVARSPSPEESP